MDDLPDLPPKERAAKYRQYASDAERWAARSNGAVQVSYRIIAVQWRKLADDLDPKGARKMN